MLQKFLHGAAFGAGFCVAVLVVLAVVVRVGPGISIRSSERIASGPPGEPRTATRQVEPQTDAPPLRPRRLFLGSLGAYVGGFDLRRPSVLATGRGRIAGSVADDDGPVEGLRLRLALNGSARSAWTTTDATGAYAVAVPLGQYRIDGYELDHESADVALAGKTDHPANTHSSSEFEVTENRDGEGLKLRYVDPVVKTGPSGYVSPDDDVALTWAPYPNAARYVIQLHEIADIRRYEGHREVFPWNDRPAVSELSFDLDEAGVELKPGYYYTFDVTAFDENGRPLSRSASEPFVEDFRTIE